MPAIDLNTSIKLLLGRDEYGLNAPTILLTGSDLLPAKIFGVDDTSGHVVLPDGFRLSYPELSWMMSAAACHGQMGLPAFKLFNGVDLTIATYKHTAEANSQPLFNIPYDGLLLWKESLPGIGLYQAHYLPTRAYQELYELYPTISMLWSVFEACPEMKIHPTIARFSWKCFQVEFAKTHVEVRDIVRGYQINVSPQMVNQLTKAANLTDDTVLAIFDYFHNRLNNYIGVFQDGLPRLNGIILTHQDFVSLRALLSLMKFAF